MASSECDRVTEADIEATIFSLLANRQIGATLCPSEVARAVLPGGDRWRQLMPRIRQVAQRLAQADRVTVTRRGAPVEATSPGGPIRLGHPPGRNDG